MFLIDKILLSPIYGTIWIAKQVNNAVQQAHEDEGEHITAELRELYMMLETGRITEEEFDKKEEELLDRLDEIQGEPDKP